MSIHISQSTSLNAFSKLMSKKPLLESSLRDRCDRPVPTYNKNYNPYQPPPEDLSPSYSPYIFGEPLFDDRPLIIANLSKGYAEAGAAKKPRTSWVWRLGYALVNTNSKGKAVTFWCCKHCHHDTAFSKFREFLFNSNTLKNAETHLRDIHRLDEGGDIWRIQNEAVKAQASGIIDNDIGVTIPFRQLEFKNAFLEWVILDNVKLRKASSLRLKRVFQIASQQAVNAFPSSHSTISSWIHEMFAYFEPEIIEEVRTAKSRISISFDGWGSKHEKISLVGVVVHFINAKYENVTRLIGLPELPSHGKSGIEQASVIYPLLCRFGITSVNLGHFVLDNALNNDTTLLQLSKRMDFDHKERRLRCMGHIINLIAQSYLFGQDSSSFENEFGRAGAQERRELWRRRGAIGKLHNLTAHVMASGKRSDLFLKLQDITNLGAIEGKRWKLVLDGGVRWNSSYLMIRRALELREALDTYAAQLNISKDQLDKEIFQQDYLDDDEWEVLGFIKEHLQPLFYLTKDLEGNTTLQEGAGRASHGALWETLPVFEFILGHFEKLEILAKAGEFNYHPGIQSSITLAWNKANEYYNKTDMSIAWIAGVVLHPRWKWAHFEKNWTGGDTQYVNKGKLRLRQLWERTYRGNISQPQEAPAELERTSYLESILNQVAPTGATHRPRPTARCDQLALYLKEPPIDHMGVMEYWKSREKEWPQLALMAFDFLAIPAMSSECERVFSSCANITTSESSQLTGESLWHQECLKNWANRACLTAFALSPSCCDGQSKIGPITQPDYIGLRLDESLIQHDVLDHIDFHLTSPAKHNSRLTDLGSDNTDLRKNRLGIYLHWSLPRFYRAASQFADSTKADPSAPADADRSQPVFPKVPNRYLVVRKLSAQAPANKLPEYQTWVIESDRRRRIEDIPDGVDLETDVTPFVAYEGDPKAPDVLTTQAEVFIGQRHEHSGWIGKPNGWKEDLSGDAKWVDLTVMSAANPLFADYVPHNGSVFSIVDAFSYQEAGTTQNLTSATADYFVTGWHSKQEDDPLGAEDAGTLRTKLRSLFLNLNTEGLSGDESQKVGKLLDSRAPSRVLLHGAIYNVKFDVNSKPRSLADEAARRFTSETKIEPLSVGTTPLDGVLTFLEAHREGIETIFGTGTKGVTDDILQLATLLYTADDSYDSRVKAQDMLYTNNWNSSQGGSLFKFDGKAGAGKPAAAPSKDEVEALALLNENQALFDVLGRKIQSLQWSLFAEWWKFVSDRSNVTAIKMGQYAKRVEGLKENIKSFQAKAGGLKKTIDENSGAIPRAKGIKTPVIPPNKKIPQSTYFTKKDPTLCIAGLDSGFPIDFLDKVNIKADHQLSDPSSVPDLKKVFGSLASPIPSGSLRNTANKILAESLSRTKPSNAATYPKGFKQWGDANPFQPMFIEWEGLYYHIDRTKWDVGVRSSPVGHAHSQVRFSVDEPLYENIDNQKDYRYVSGRVLILPQPVFSLQSIVKQVLENSGPEMTLTKEQVKGIEDNISKLKFISAPLDGLTQHLLTRYMGTHVTPNIRVQGKMAVPMEYAWNSDGVREIGFGKDGMALIDSESNTTPYGNLVPFDPATYTKVPFKGVTHGQMLLTKLNVIDKFGQAVCLPPPKPAKRLKEQPPVSIHPCLSDFLTPDIVNGVINTVYPEPIAAPGKWPLCRFLQLTPSINQEARINASFVNRNDSSQYPFWHETVDDLPESPLFGWIVVNYQDYGLQFFLADGTFYREIRVGGPTGTVTGSKWLPFDPPKDKDTGNRQLDELISQLSDGNYLQGFFDVINEAIKTMPYPPSDYAAYANSLVGKPLALVNVGWSLELSTPALEAQNTRGNTPSDVASELASYNFPIKIGDADRPFDGVVGYFISDNVNNGQTDWSKFHTYFPSKATTKIVDIGPSNFPTLAPKYIKPQIGFPVAGVQNPRSFGSYIEARTAQYLITTMLIDPYTPIHAYSPMLPIKSITLANWTMQKAFSRMTAFFRLGPSLISQDVPKAYDPLRPLNTDTWLETQSISNTPSTALVPLPVGAPTPPPPIPNIKLPIAGKKGLWQWLQPYDEPGEKDGDPRVTRYNALGVEQEDSRIRGDAAPYTFVEGYLQLARPLLKENVRV